MSELQLLKSRYDELLAVYKACVNYAHEKLKVRIFVHAWLPEVGLALAQLERLIVQLEAAREPPAAQLRAAWTAYYRVYAALEPTRKYPEASTSDSSEASKLSQNAPSRKD